MKKDIEKSAVIIDDQNAPFAGLRKELKLQGWTAYSASSASDGVGLGRVVRPLVVFVDLQIRQVNGFEMCRKIRNETWSARTVIVAAADQLQGAVEEHIFTSGIDVYLRKPMNRYRLARILDRAAIVAAAQNQARPCIVKNRNGA